MLREAGNASVTRSSRSVCHLDGTCLLPPRWPAPEGDGNKSAGACVFSTVSNNVSHVGVGRKWIHFVCQPVSAQMHLAGSPAGRGRGRGGCCGERARPAWSLPTDAPAHRQLAAASCLACLTQPCMLVSKFPLNKPNFWALGLVFSHPHSFPWGNSSFASCCRKALRRVALETALASL